MCISCILVGRQERKYEHRGEINKEFPRDGEEVKGDQKTSDDIGRNGCKVLRGEEINERNEEDNSVARKKMRTLEKKEKHYKLVRAYPPQGKCGNK